MNRDTLGRRIDTNRREKIEMHRDAPVNRYTPSPRTLRDNVDCRVNDSYEYE